MITEQEKIKFAYETGIILEGMDLTGSSSNSREAVNALHNKCNEYLQVLIDANDEERAFKTIMVWLQVFNLLLQPEYLKNFNEIHFKYGRYFVNQGSKTKLYDDNGTYVDPDWKVQLERKLSAKTDEYRTWKEEHPNQIRITINQPNGTWVGTAEEFATQVSKKEKQNG